jgi:hypothetical protein
MNILTVNLQPPCHLYMPKVVRYMPSEHVKAFFEDGSLRLSSFTAFSKHESKVTKDDEEGKATVLSHHPEHPSSGIGFYGVDCYVLCGSLLDDESQMLRFGMDSYIRIHDCVSFWSAVGRSIEGLVHGFQGPCVYRDGHMIEQTYMGTPSFNPFDGSADALSPEEQWKLITQDQFRQGGGALFLKDARYYKDCEYRFHFTVQGHAQEYIYIKCPEAIPFCESGPVPDQKMVQE